MDSVEIREKRFHDEAFADGRRARVAPFYALTRRSQLYYEFRLKNARLHDQAQRDGT